MAIREVKCFLAFTELVGKSETDVEQEREGDQADVAIVDGADAATTEEAHANNSSKFCVILNSNLEFFHLELSSFNNFVNDQKVYDFESFLETTIEDLVLQMKPLENNSPAAQVAAQAFIGNRRNISKVHVYKGMYMVLII